MKTAILVTARLKSTRLPLKVIKMIKGKPMICHLLDRLKLSKRSQQLIICTSPLEQDDPLWDIANQENVACFRGDPDDVLIRLRDAAQKYAVDTVVNCTADNPFVDPEYIDKLVDFTHKYDYDFSCSKGLPFGTFSYCLRYDAIVKACEIKEEKDTEVWGGYFTETGFFKCGTLDVNSEDVNWPELRLTVDTPDDFELAAKIFDNLYEPGKIFSLRDIVSLCRAKPDLVEINSMVVQKTGVPIKIRSDL